MACECKKNRIVADANTNDTFCPICGEICDISLCAMSVRVNDSNMRICLFVAALIEGIELKNIVNWSLK